MQAMNCYGRQKTGFTISISSCTIIKMCVRELVSLIKDRVYEKGTLMSEGFPLTFFCDCINVVPVFVRLNLYPLKSLATQCSSSWLHLANVSACFH